MYQGLLNNLSGMEFILAMGIIRHEKVFRFFRNIYKETEENPENLIFCIFFFNNSVADLAFFGEINRFFFIIHKKQAKHVDRFIILIKALLFFVVCFFLIASGGNVCIGKLKKHI